jgi:hypothetical protein
VFDRFQWEVDFIIVSFEILIRQRIPFEDFLLGSIRINALRELLYATLPAGIKIAPPYAKSTSFIENAGSFKNEEN